MIVSSSAAINFSFDSQVGFNKHKRNDCLLTQDGSSRHEINTCYGLISCDILFSHQKNIATGYVVYWRGYKDSLFNNNHCLQK